MVSTIVLAALAGVATTATAAVTTGDASVVTNAAHALPPGLHVALAHVPSAMNAFAVLKQHLSLYAGMGTIGAAAGGGAAVAAKHGLHVGLG